MFVVLFLLLFVMGVVLVLVTWFVDCNQIFNLVLCNFLVIGYFCYGFLWLGEFFC